MIAEYFLTRNIETGERFFQEFNRKCKHLIQFPLMERSYASVDDGLRGLPIEGYIILYRITKETQLEIVRVVKGTIFIPTGMSDDGCTIVCVIIFHLTSFQRLP